MHRNKNIANAIKKAGPQPYFPEKSRSPRLGKGRLGRICMRQQNQRCQLLYNVP